MDKIHSMESPPLPTQKNLRDLLGGIPRFLGLSWRWAGSRAHNRSRTRLNFHFKIYSLIFRKSTTGLEPDLDFAFKFSHQQFGCNKIGEITKRGKRAEQDSNPPEFPLSIFLLNAAIANVPKYPYKKCAQRGPNPTCRGHHKVNQGSRGRLRYFHA